MYGLSVRWSLTDAPDGVLERLHEYVESESHAKFAGLPGLRFKTWRAREGEWFEGTYVFVSDEARAAFQADFEKRAADAPGTALVGVTPTIEPYQVVAVVRGPAGFRSAARFED
ncbi:hypothetical protein SAMN06295964_2321 [Aeromicrobium choanae]|uniref:Mono-oxygenase ydhR n=1 Tax=Aeromicrobium choanae TaxID=1736691 RepID=A0A1T4Z5D7_9ACTN|nr:hypothetical protein SAMN06295964_2321 [Aeromicrobium choanae]